MRKDTLTVGLFFALTLLLSAVFWFLRIQAGQHGLPRYLIEGLMWCPGAAALLTVSIRGLQGDPLGLRWGGLRSALGAYFLPLAYASVAYSLLWVLGFGGFPSATEVRSQAAHLGWQGLSSAAFVPLYLLLIGTTVIASGTARALGEELGWRGFLVPYFVRWFGFTGGAISIGIIHGLWHLPIILFSVYNNGTPAWVSLPCFFTGIVSLSVLLTWFRLRSGSVWPCAILHASHNLFVQVFFDPFTTPRGALTPYLISEFGVALPVTMMLFALGFWMARQRSLGAHQLVGRQSGAPLEV